jgi:hypothetical protein
MNDVRYKYPDISDEKIASLEYDKMFNQAFPYPFQISKINVTAPSRKLSAQYTLEPQKEIVAKHAPESEIKTWRQTASGLFVRK